MTKKEISAVRGAYERLMRQPYENIAKKTFGMMEKGKKISDEDYSTLKPFLNSMRKETFFVGNVELSIESNCTVSFTSFNNENYVEFYDGVLETFNRMMRTIIMREEAGLHTPLKYYFGEGDTE